MTLCVYSMNRFHLSGSKKRTTQGSPVLEISESVNRLPKADWANPALVRLEFGSW